MIDLHMPSLRVLVDHPVPLLASGLAAALHTEAGFEVVTRHDLSSGVDAPIDVVVTDYARGLLMAREKAVARSAVGVMVMALHDTEQAVRAAMEAGVQGYILVTCSVEELATGIRTLASGLKYVSMQVAQKIADSLTRQSLTARETDVLGMVALGMCNKSISCKLDISVGTVKTHLRSIFGKLDCASRTQAARIAMQRGLVGEMTSPLPMPVLPHALLGVDRMPAANRPSSRRISSG